MSSDQTVDLLAALQRSLEQAREDRRSRTAKWELEDGDPGTGLLVHNHDLDPTCAETRNSAGRLVGACLSGQTVKDQGASRDPRTPGGRLAVLRNMTDGDRRAMLAFISGYAPDVFDVAASRHQ
jgi:hypothetical protein